MSNQVDRDCADLLKDVPEYIIKQMQEAEDPKSKLSQLKDDLARKKNLVLKSKNAQIKLFTLLEQHPNGATVGLRSILANDLYAKANNSNVEYRQKALQGIVESKLLNVKKELSTTNLGYSRNVELGDDFVRAVFGNEDASPLAKKMAKEWEDASEFMRTRFNEYGGNIGKLDYGYIKQSHNADAIRATSKEEWVNFIEPLLRDDMADIDLKYVYDTIATGGLNKVKEGSAALGKGKAVANKNAEERILHFKDADSWLAYQKKFGNPDPMAAIDDTIRGMTMDMSLVEIMGPNPTHMYETLKLKRDKLRGAGKHLEFDSYTDAIWNVVSGKVDQNLDGISRIGEAAQYLRAMNTATMLGSATLSAITDTASLFVNTAYHGINPFKVAKQFVKNFNVKNMDDAIRMGLGADVFNSSITARYTELAGKNFWSKASEALMRATFMNIWTEAARKSFQVEYMHKLLNGRKATDLSTDELIKMLEKVNTEADYAVLMPTARTRAITTGGYAKGTGAGEVFRQASQFHSFTTVFMQQHGARMFMQGTVGNRISYGASIFVLSTMLGAIAMMAKDSSKGLTPREGGNVFSEDVPVEDNAKFWTAAAMQGGGAGFLGDLLFSDQTRYGNSPIPSAIGPTASVVEDLIKLTVGNAQEAAKGDTTHFSSESVDFVNRHMNPTNAFYVKAVFDNYVARNMKILLDPEYEKAERRKERKRKKEYGQETQQWLQDSRESVTENLGVYQGQDALENTQDKLTNLLKD
jgi:hypothetical protein